MEDKSVTYTYSPLLTDLYQLTMAYGYWQLNMHDQEANFHLLFRKNPFKGNYAVSCGLASVIDFLKQWRFQEDDLAYLATLENQCGEPLFPQAFLDYLGQLHFTCDLEAIPEGTVVFPHIPLLRVQGPLLQCQLLESPLLNIINFQTLIATKASRVCRAAEDYPVIEFGMRRAQGPDGALSASRAAYIGGCIATSNTLAGKLYDIPVRGTHAHSWVSAFPTELESFTAYASVMPHNCVLLVDTYNTIQGVKNAIHVGQKLREQGADLIGIRLDSGDIADLSIKSRQLLDEAGFEKADIVASNSLDEYVISSLKEQNAKISSYGVGTHLATAYDQPALDGVYKLSALQDNNGEWLYKLKLSDSPSKISNPGRHQVRRFFCNDQHVLDVVYDLSIGILETPEVILLNEEMQEVRLDDYDASVDLLQPIFSRGKLIAKLPSVHETREQAIANIETFYEKHGDKIYSVGIESKLHHLKQQIIDDLKKKL